MLLYDQPEIFKSFPHVLAAQSKRLGGVSEAPFTSLNLGLATDDNQLAIEQNRTRFFEAIGISEMQLASSHQVHGVGILVADVAIRAKGYDAIITNKRNVYAAVTVADCTPILIYDAKQKAVAAIHAGWRGTVAQIVYATLQQMQSLYGTNGENCFAYVGTCISYESFEVDEEVANQFDEDLVHFDSARKKYRVNLKAANQKQLLQFGIPELQIQLSEKCTVLHNNEYFSYRKEQGKTGRMLAVIGMRGE